MSLNKVEYVNHVTHILAGNMNDIQDEIIANAGSISSLNSIVSNKVDKVSGKGLSTNDYTTAEKTKLSGIATGAEVNVQADWNVTDASSDAYIQNKPTAITDAQIDALFD